MSGATYDATAQARQAANITQGAGAAQAGANVRQATADTIGQASQTTSDPNKALAVASQANMQALKGYQSIDAQTAVERSQKEDQLVQTMANEGREETKVDAQNKAALDAEKGKSTDLMASGASDFMAMDTDNKMIGAYGDIQAGTFDADKYNEFKKFRV